jgi:ectoine hydroxylase-related dioxygenase (phytanoyl-CoA dioxygenase family)
MRRDPYFRDRIGETCEENDMIACPRPGPDQRRSYAERGAFVLERAIGASELALLRAVCDHEIADCEAEISAAERSDGRSIHRRGRYFITFPSRRRRELDGFLYGELMAEICRATIGDDAYLFYDQMVVKGTDAENRFAWHQDSGYVGHDHRPYVTCWCALDDMTIDNGTVHILPYDRAPSRSLLPHAWSAAENGFVGYAGNDPGDAMLVPAGSIVVFSSLVLHRSGCNCTDRYRRSYVVQYSPEVVLTPDGSALHSLAVPFLRGGRLLDQSFRQEAVPRRPGNPGA